MKSQCNNYPPITPDDILTIRGDPVSKMIIPNHRLDSVSLEKWIYYTYKNTKEFYLFKNGYLVGYEKE